RLHRHLAIEYVLQDALRRPPERVTIAAPARRLDHHRVSGLQMQDLLRMDRLDTAIGPANVGPGPPAGKAAEHAPGRGVEPLGAVTALHRPLQDSERAADAEPPAKLAGAAGIDDRRVLDDLDRVLRFPGFRRRRAAVREA